MNFGSKVIAIFVIHLTFISSAFPQSFSKRSRHAEKTFYEESYQKALAQYQQLKTMRPDNPKVQYRLELCSLLVKDYRTKPLDQLLNFSKSEGAKDRFYNFWLGRIYLSRYRFKEAITAFEAFLALDVYKSVEITEIAQNFLQSAQRSQSAYNNPQLFELIPLPAGINNANSPQLLSFSSTDNHIFYTDKNDSGTTRLYEVERKDNDWSAPVLIPTVPVPNKNIDLEFLRPSELLYKHERKEINLLTKVNGSWRIGDQYELDFPAKNTGSHLTMSADENRIIFSEKDFLGYFDLYEMVKTNGNWSRPKFIEEINTPGNEVSPFLSQDGSTLYYSSDGQGAIGGFDIFMTKLDSNTWSSPVSLGYPINTSDDELNYIVNAFGDGYLLSDRIGGEGGSDIFYAKKLEFNEIEGFIANSNTGKFVPGLRIEFRPKSFPSESFISRSNEMGKYESRIITGTEVNVSVFKNEKLIHQEAMTLAKNTSSDIIRQDFKIPISDSESLSLAQSLTTNENSKVNDSGYSPLDFIANKFRPGRKAMLNNVYFKFGTSELAEGSDRALSILMKLMNNNLELRIEIAGHTDSLGPGIYNIWLSRKRAEVIYNYLVQRGVDSNRLLVRGYGETRPIASNDDEINGRSLNRRIEIVVAE